MQFLADESCDFAIVRTLRAQGHDVLAVLEICRGAEDSKVIALARQEGRVLLTEDKDFGQLAYAGGVPEGGVILLRYPAKARATLCEDLVKLVKRYGEKLKRSFVVMQPGRTRIRGKI